MAVTSRMNREVHVRYCERLEVKFLRPTRQREPRRGNINAPEDGGSPCSSVEASVMDVERRGGQSKMGDFGQLGNQEEPHDLNRKRLFSQGNNLIAMKSRVRRESQARFCERLVVKFHRPTRQPPEGTFLLHSHTFRPSNAVAGARLIFISLKCEFGVIRAFQRRTECRASHGSALQENYNPLVHNTRVPHPSRPLRRTKGGRPRTSTGHRRAPVSIHAESPRHSSNANGAEECSHSMVSGEGPLSKAASLQKKALRRRTIAVARIPKNTGARPWAKCILDRRSCGHNLYIKKGFLR